MLGSSFCSSLRRFKYCNHAIILIGKRELVTFLLLCSECMGESLQD